MDLESVIQNEVSQKEKNKIPSDKFNQGGEKPIL